MTAADLRHTFATIAIANASIYDVSKELGHSEIRTTDKIYVKQTDRKNTRAISAVAAQIDNKDMDEGNKKEEVT